MDHGQLTDHNGKKIDFRNVILIMTTNAGASEAQKAAIGFGSTRRTGDDVEAINRLFTPEFRNRLDAIIPFGALPTPVIHEVVQKFVMQLEAQLSERGVTFELHQDAIAWLAEKGYDEYMGARPLGRVIQEYVKKPLADEVLFGKLKHGGTVKVTVVDDEAGGKKLHLEAIADETPIKARKSSDAKGRRTKVDPSGEEIVEDEDDFDDAEDVDEDGEGEEAPGASAPDADAGSKAGRRPGTVPKVPRKPN